MNKADNFERLSEININTAITKNLLSKRRKTRKEMI
jgi:hypothetical protein